MLFLCMTVSLDIWLEYFSDKLICLFLFVGGLIVLSGISINSFISYGSYQSSDLIFEKELIKYSEEYSVDIWNIIYISDDSKIESDMNCDIALEYEFV